MCNFLNRAPLISDPLQEYYLGRRGAIAVACLIAIAATIGQCFSYTVVQLMCCRALKGLALAAKASAAPLLIAEVSPDYFRGNRYPLNFEGTRLMYGMPRKSLVNMATK